MKRTVIVARVPGEQLYACAGRIDGWDTIRTTSSIMEAFHFGSAAGLMSRFGGHYRGYEAVEVEIETNIIIGSVIPFPPEKEVWGDE